MEIKRDLSEEIAGEAGEAEAQLFNWVSLYGIFMSLIPKHKSQPPLKVSLHHAEQQKRQQSIMCSTTAPKLIIIINDIFDFCLPHYV